MILDVDFEFARLSEDKEIAIFTMDPGLERYHKIIRRRLKTALVDTPIDAPVHTVQIRHALNDTPVPGLAMDYEKWEWSIDWRQLYTCYFGEQQLRDRLMSKWAKGNEEWTLEIKRKLDGGEIDVMTYLEKAVSEFGGGYKEAQKLARRARICRQYKQRDGYEYDFEQDGDLSQEKVILQRLTEKENLTYFEEYSDDEDEGDEEEEEQVSTIRTFPDPRVSLLTVLQVTLSYFE